MFTLWLRWLRDFRTAFDALILARIFQGVGAACIMSMNAALVRATYPAKMLGRGIGYNALVLSMSAAAGPTLAAIILSVGSVAVAVPDQPADRHRRHHRSRSSRFRTSRGHGHPFDWIAALLERAMMGCTVFGAETLTRESVGARPALVVIGIGSGALLVRPSRAILRPFPRRPLEEPHLQHVDRGRRRYSFAAQMLAFVTLPFLFQSVLGRTAFETGC